MIFSMTCSPAVIILASLEECVLFIKIVNISNNSNNIINNSKLDLVTTEIIAMIRVNLDVCGSRGDGSWG